MVEIDPQNYWLFGYGSLIFKEPPHVVERVPGYVRNVVRRFWQSSIDHRGTPESPGRVVTLITADYWSTLHDPHVYGKDDVVYGMAYRIDPLRAAEVREYMDFREKHGYTDIILNFRSLQGAEWACITYVGTPGNHAFVGPEDPERLAQIIAQCEGPSGRNIDYLLRLHAAVQQLSQTEDAHIADLVKRTAKYAI